MKDNRSMLFAVILSVLTIFIWDYFFAAPQLRDNKTDSGPKGVESATMTPAKPISIPPIATVQPEEELALSPVVAINSPELEGSIELRGLKFNNLKLLEFKQETDKNQPVALFISKRGDNPYYVEFGFLSNRSDLIMPNAKTLWSADREILQPNEPVTLSYTNPQGMLFKVILKLDEHYMFSVTQEVVNHSESAIPISVYGLITRTHVEDAKRNMMVHEGGIGVSGGTLQEISFKDIGKTGKVELEGGANWLGFSDKYWLSAFIPQFNGFSGRFARFYNAATGSERFQADFTSALSEVEAQGSMRFETLLFAGAKKLQVIEGYKDKYNIPLFDRAVDFGVLYFITKPIFMLLSYFYSLTKNFGYAIVVLTVVIKLLLFPLAYKGFKSMNRLKGLQPKMQELKERYKDKPEQYQKALLEFYKKEKANPLSGCLPLLLQMPIFFALYKVLYVTIEMRGAPFIWWIHDLSAPDPTNIFTLFGLLPITLPSFLHIGIFPILMSVSMYVQQQLSPSPQDPTQALMMKFLPVIFLFMFASFPSGLVIYITVSNVLSILQQVVIKKI